MRASPLSSNMDDSSPGLFMAGAGWRRYALGLVPLALAGLLPWWGTLLLGVVYALGVRFEAWRDGRLLLSLLVVALAVLPGLPAVAQGGKFSEGMFWTVFLRYLAVLVGVGGVYWATELLAEGRRRGLLLLALLGLLAPGPLLLLALAGGALSRESLDDRAEAPRMVSAQEARSRRAFLAWTAAGVLALTALGAGLPRYAPSLPTQISTSSVQPPSEAKPPVFNAPRPAPAPGPLTQRWGWRWQPGRIPVPPLDVTLVLSLLLSGSLLWRLLQLRGEGERKRVQWLQVLMILGLVLNGLILYLLAVMQSAGGGESAAASDAGGAAQATAAGTTSFERVLNIPLDILNGAAWVMLVFQGLLVAVGLWFLWRLRLPPEEPEQAVGLALARSGALAPEAAQHRVRVAYRQAAAALQEHGWGRAAAETPAGYAARLAQVQALFGSPLRLLTQLYGPVRYGGRVSEEEAAQAEQAAQELVVLAAAHPFHEDTHSDEQTDEQAVPGLPGGTS